ncbi:MAG: DNA alkylation repair protein [Caulobacteraceae bacterium]|nr:DNA alkylation repair protein [Caulobacteraceae bacterium]
MHPEHAKLLTQIQAMGRPPREGPPLRDSYGGSGHPFYSVGVPERRAIARAWIAERRGGQPSDALAVLDSLFAGDSHEEKTLPSFILAVDRAARRAVQPSDVERWLGELNGWAEIDCLCQSVFTAEDLATDWPAWKSLIERLAADENINKRRAAMVLLNAPVRASDDRRFRDLALEVVDLLKGERDILITKAVSWLLRTMTIRHRLEIEHFLAREADRLPKVAVRETRLKLATGTKSGRARTIREPG